MNSPFQLLELYSLARAESTLQKGLTPCPEADAIDLDEAIRGSEAAEELISKWSFSRELTAEIQE
jgi:hypothetical protein